MKNFQILCVTMNQSDFTKVKKMNIHSDVVFANQSKETRFDKFQFENHEAIMITTNTKGVGINRNLSLIYATAEICLFADDDVVYVDNVEKIVIEEFQKYPDADIIIFNIESAEGGRSQKNYTRTRRHRRYERMPWGGCRVAIRTASIKRANLWFTTLYGGGCLFPSGEDSIWLNDAKKRGLKFYVSKEYIGTVHFDSSTWFTGYDEKFFFGKGAYYGNVHPKTIKFWYIYMATRTSKLSNMKFMDKIYWMKKGRKGYELLIGYEEFIHKYCE